MRQHHIDTIKDLFHRLAGNPSPVPEPQLGMQWHITQHRARPHSIRGYHEGLANVQLVRIDNEEIDYLYNSQLVTMPRSDWATYYEGNLRRARSAAHRHGGGSIIPEYEGIRSVNHEYVETLRNPEPLPSFF